MHLEGKGDRLVGVRCVGDGDGCVIQVVAHDGSQVYMKTVRVSRGEDGNIAGEFSDKICLSKVKYDKFMNTRLAIWPTGNFYLLSLPRDLGYPTQTLSPLPSVALTLFPQTLLLTLFSSDYKSIKTKEMIPLTQPLLDVRPLQHSSIA